ncbi:MAG: RNA-processing protein [Candidatus Aenigmarchaeota archaeon]|nr:RNA-processing protein [Candidatus Aenigmarchaeota archaeon]
MTDGFLKIPKMRIGVIIGKSGETKKKLEDELGAKIDINSEGEISYSAKDPLNQMKLADILKAIGRGFTPDEALVLETDEYILHIIDLDLILNKNEKAVERYKSRIIGTGGTIRKKIEDMTDTKICVYGKTASIIGLPGNVQIANEAVQMILDGMTHKAVYAFLDKKSMNL